MKTVFQTFYKEYRTICLALLLCIVLGIVSVFVSPGSGKKNTHQSYVYQKDSKTYSTAIQSLLPVVNLKGKDAKKVNQTFQKLYEQKDTVLTYKYTVNGDYLSIVYCTITWEEESPVYEVKTFVFNLPKRRLITTKELLKLFAVQEDTVRKTISDKMKYYYEDAAGLGYIERNECDYNCFITSRHYQEDAPFYLAIENDQLVAYQSFYIDGFYRESEYFKEDHFRFVITE